MPFAPPRICGCGYKIASGSLCPCEERRSQERKARHEAQRPSASERGYGGKWQAARDEYLRSHPHCIKCGQPSRVVDHITPHKGDQRLFWSRSNWQPLCTPCHSGAKQAEDRRTGVGRQFGRGAADRRGEHSATFARNRKTAP